MKLLLLSAGLGTRLAPVTTKIPKPAVPLLTVPMIFYPFYHFNNVTRVIVNTFHLPEVLKTTLQKQSRNFSAELISDGAKILGSGGGIKNAESFLRDDGNFSVANSDAVFLPDDLFFLDKAKNVHKSKLAAATIVVIEDERIKEKGWGAVWTDESDHILGVGKIKPKDAKKGYHYIGYLILDDKIFDSLPKDFPPVESNIFEDAILPIQKLGRTIQIYKTTGKWFETGSVPEYLEATKELLLEYSKGNRFLRTLLKNFSPHHQFYSTNKTSFDKKVNTSELDFLLTEKNTYKIAEDVKLEGFVVIGNNVTIESGAHIKDSVLLDNVTITKNSNITDQLKY